MRDTAKPENYEITKLREDVEPVAVSPNGEYVLALGDFETESFVLWHDGEYTTVGRPEGALVEATPVDVNDSGEAVVNFVDPNLDMTEAWLYRDGELRRLPGADTDGKDAQTESTAIDADGTVVGMALFPDRGYLPAVWESGDGEPRDLPVVKADDHDGEIDGRATDVFDGAVVGIVGQRNWLWPDGGKARELDSSDGDGSWPKVSGDWVLADGNGWNLAEDHERSDFGEARVNAIDSCGRGYGASGELDGRPIVHDGTARRLPELAQSGFERDEPETPYGSVHAASADGSVLVGESMGHKVLWTYA